MNSPRWRSSFAFLLLLVLLVPILAACGGTAATPAQTTAAPVTDAGGAEATTATDSGAAEATLAPEAEATTATDAGDEATADTGAETEVTAAAGGDTADPSAISPAGSKLLRLPYATEPDNIDPQRVSFVHEIAVVMANYQPLMRFDPDSLEAVPGAAESTELSQDGKTITFKLKPDQKYSDGEPLTAANFEYGWKRLCDPAVASDYQYIASAMVGCDEYFNAFTTGGLTVTSQTELQGLRDAVGARAVDETTLEIQLEEAAPYFLNVAALWVGAPTREDLVEQGGENWWQNPDTYIGNGPFQLTQWEPQGRMQFERNDNWVLAGEINPKIEAIERIYYAEASIAFEAYRSDEIDMLAFAEEELPTVQADPQLQAQVIDTGGQCTFYLAFNHAIPPFDKKEIRQAFAQGFDREAYVRDVLKGLGTPAYSFVPPGIPGHDEQAQQAAQWKFDAAAAKQKLQDAGFDFNTPLKLTYSSSALNKLRNEYLASRFQADLGIKMTLDPVERTTYTALTKDPQTTPPMFILGWCLDFPDPQNWLSAVFKSGGSASARISWSSPEYDALISQADVLPIDDPERARLYNEAQKMLVEEAPVAFMYYDQNPYLVKPWVTGVNSTNVDPTFPGFYDLGAIDIKTE